MKKHYVLIIEVKLNNLGFNLTKRYNTILPFVQNSLDISLDKLIEFVASKIGTDVIEDVSVVDYIETSYTKEGNSIDDVVIIREPGGKIYGVSQIVSITETYIDVGDCYGCFDIETGFWATAEHSETGKLNYHPYCLDYPDEKLKQDIILRNQKCVTKNKIIKYLNNIDLDLVDIKKLSNFLSYLYKIKE